MSKIVVSDETFQARITKVRGVMRAQGFRALIVPSGGELGYLIGHAVDSGDQGFCLVVTNDPDELPALVISKLELPAVTPRPKVFRIVPIMAGGLAKTVILMLGEDFAGRIGLGDKLWYKYVHELQTQLTEVSWNYASSIISALRRTKDAAEIEALRAVAAAVDATIRDIQTGVVPLRGRTEKAVAADVSSLLLKYGHDKVDFVIVGYNGNAADPHHEPDDTVIGDGIVMFDIGGTMDGYCSDTTRCVHVGEPSEKVARAYAVLREAQHRAATAVRIGMSGKAVDALARDHLVAAGYPSYPHSLGHGIGRETHEDPRLNERAEAPLLEHDVFSIEPGVYIEGDYGMRLESIYVLTANGAEPLNLTPDDLIVVEP